MPVRRLDKSIRADAAIVGAGVSGAFMAEALSRRFESVVVLERRGPARGATAASTAMLQFEIDEPLTAPELERIVSFMLGREHGQDLSWDQFTASTQPLDDVRAKLGLRADRPVDGFTAAIGLCGVVLARHFPPRADNRNELPDHLILL